MGQNNRRWIIRDTDGKIDGPFTTEKILHKIGRGEFLGDESIAHYPDGKWIAISRDPQFYDKLLEVLSQKDNEELSADTNVFEFSNPENNKSKAAKSVAEPSRESPPPEPKIEPVPPPDSDAEPEVLEAAPSSRASRRKRRDRRSSEPQDIELVDTRPEVWREIARRGTVPILVAIAGAAIAAVLLNSGNEAREERVHLVAPQKGVTQVAAESLKPRVRQGVSEFLNDTFDGYQRAQNDLVYVVERDSKNAEVMALLCMDYLQLWPYAKQDSNDTKAIGTVVQMSAAVDPGGLHSATCRVVDLTVRGRYAEAKSLVESMLDSRANESSPPIVFYFLKGFLLEGAGDHASAINYLQSVEKLWPQWLLPYVTEAQALSKMEKFGDAATTYRQVLKSNPAHAVARLELGLLEYKHFDHFDQGEQYLNQALEGENAPRGVLSRGYFGLAEIALKKGDQKRALKFAQKSFSLNSSNAGAKNLIVQLGGVEKLRSTRVKGQQLIFEGDQFAREGDCQSAQAHYKAAFEEDTKDAYAALKAAQCLWKLSFSTEAIEWLNRSIQADPTLMEAYVTMADYQAQRYNFMAAARILEQAKRVNGKSYEVYRGFALVELKRGNAEGALTFGKVALQLYENDVETQILMAQAALAKKDYKMAYNYAARAVEIDVNHRQAQIVYAESMAGLQGVDVGVDYYLKLVNNYPLVSEYRLALGKMLLADERYQQAEEVFRQIIHLDEKPKAAYVELAKVLRAQGGTGEALDLLLKAAVLDPADAEPLYLAGGIYLDIKKPQEAAVQYQRVLTINKLYPLVHYQMGRASLMMGDPKEALNQTEAEKKLNPNLADAYILAAEAHVQMKQFSNCAVEYQKAIKLRPQQANIYVKSAQCYREVGNLDAANSMLSVASEKESGLADIYKEQAEIYKLKGDLVHAIEAYKQYFTLDPDAPDRRQIEEQISTLHPSQSP